MHCGSGSNGLLSKYPTKSVSLTLSSLCAPGLSGGCARRPESGKFCISSIVRIPVYGYNSKLPRLLPTIIGLRVVRGTIRAYMTCILKLNWSILSFRLFFLSTINLAKLFFGPHPENLFSFEAFALCSGGGEKKEASKSCEPMPISNCSLALTYDMVSQMIYAQQGEQAYESGV